MSEVVSRNIVSKNHGDFEIFKSNMCHKLKNDGDVGFMVWLLESSIIRQYFDSGEYLESLYLLGMLDYLSRVNDVPLCTGYEDLRHCRFAEPVFPSSIIVLSSVLGNSVEQDAANNAIPEFMRYNIVEGDVRDAV